MSGPVYPYIIPVAAPGGAAAYTFRDAQNGSPGGSDTRNFSVDIGTAAADRLVIVAGTCQNIFPLASVVVNGVTLTVNATADNSTGTGVQSYIASGLVTAGSGVQTVAVTFTGGAFNNYAVVVWTATGLNSNTVKQIMEVDAGNSGNISVTAGDFLFSVTFANSTPSYAASTEVPDATHTTGAAQFVNGPDWTVDATNASFLVSATPSDAGIVAATFA